ncbi:MAG: DUF4215 domain-containing protein [Myxococcales bacterium]
MRRMVSAMLVAVLALPSLPSIARAGDPEADARFEEGKRLLKAAKEAKTSGRDGEAKDLVQQGCAALEDSQRRETAAIKHLWLAICYEESGRDASAWKAYQRAWAEAWYREDIRRSAQQKISSLEPKLPRLVIEVAPEARVEGLRIAVDGENIDAEAWGRPIPVDVGAHPIVTSAPRRKTKSSSVLIATAGQTVKFKAPELGLACGDGVVDNGEQCDDGNRTSGDGCSATCTIEPRCGNAHLEVGEQCDDGNRQDGDGCNAMCTLEPPPMDPRVKWSWITGGVGVAGLAVGTVGLIMANQHWNNAKGACGADGCTPDASDSVTKARTFGVMADVGFVVGVAGVGTATYLLLTRPAARKPAGALRVTPAVGTNGGSLLLQGSF